MLKSIVIKKPDDPIEFLIKKLQEPEGIDYSKTIKLRRYL